MRMELRSHCTLDALYSAFPAANTVRWSIWTENGRLFFVWGKGYEALTQIGLIKQDKPVLYTGLDSLLLEHFAKLFDEQKSYIFTD